MFYDNSENVRIHYVFVLEAGNGGGAHTDIQKCE